MTVAIIGGSGTITYTWEESANGTSGWAAASGATNLNTYTPPSVIAGTLYYRVTISASGNDCNPVTSTVTTVIIRPDLVITTDLNNIDECAGGTNALTIATTGGSGTITRTWEQSANGTSGWSAAVGATNAATYTPPSSSAGTLYYRVTVSASGSDCNPVTSSVATVVVRAAVTITTQPTNIDECIGGTNQFSIAVANGSGTITYAWEQSANGTSGWSAAVGATNATTYTPPSTSAGTIYYRVVISASGNGCANTISNVVTAIIRNDLVITTQPTNIDECVGGTNALTIATTGGSGAITYTWEQSANGTSGWSAAVGATNATTYTPPSVVAGTLYYRVVVTAANSGCDAVTSAVSTVIIRADLVITTQPQNISECIDGTVPLSVVVTGGSGTISYVWQSSSDGSSWSPVIGGTSSTYVPPSTVAGTIFYRVIISATGNDCNPQTSAAVTVTINAKPTISISVPVTAICVGGGVTLTSTTAGGAGGCVIQWQNSTDGGINWNDIPTENGATYTTPPLTTDKKYRAKYTCAGSGCCN